MKRVIVAGSGPDVGKTVVSAILATLIDADYWKPVQCGCPADTSVMETLIDSTKHKIYPAAYSCKAPLSPHHAARLENVSINPDLITPPQTKRPLIIESAGGIFVPLSTKILTFDLFKSWRSQWIIVSRHYIGSINHTLLTIDALQKREIPIIGLIFNGEANPDSEAAILEISQLPCLGRLLPEVNITPQTIQKYAEQWRSNNAFFS